MIELSFFCTLQTQFSSFLLCGANRRFCYRVRDFLLDALSVDTIWRLISVTGKNSFFTPSSTYKRWEIGSSVKQWTRSYVTLSLVFFFWSTMCVCHHHFFFEMMINEIPWQMFSILNDSRRERVRAREMIPVDWSWYWVFCLVKSI